MTVPSALTTRGRALACAATLLVLCPQAPATSAFDRSMGVFFAEPVSGRKVTEYRCELPLGPTRQASYAIPDDCEAVLEAIDEGSAYRQSILDRRMWQKVEADCRYYRFLHRHPMQGIEDHVSGYDFMNARLSDLPIVRQCSEDTPSGSACEPAATDASGMLGHLPLGRPVDGPGQEGSDAAQCRLEDGLFRGYLYTDEQGIRCMAATDAPSLRLIAVDFADINGDNVLDAVLRFVPLGPGAVRSPLMLPLTRFSDEEPFRVPPGTRLPNPPARP